MSVLDLNDDPSGTEAVEFPEWVPEDLRLPENKSLAKFKDPIDVAKSYLHAERRLGNSVQLPKEDAADDEVTKFWQKLGTPEKEDGYQIDLPEEQKAMFTEEALADVRSAAFKAKIPGKQLNAVLRALAQKQAERIKPQQEKLEKVIAEYEESLKNSYGDEFETMQGRINKLLKTRKLDEVTKNLFDNNPILKSNPLIVEALDALAQRGSSTVDPPSGSEGGGGTSVADIEREIKQIHGNPAYLNDAHPEHRKLVLRHAELHKLRRELAQ